MTSPLTEHPTSEQLQAFVLGTLRLDEVTAVEEHLADCLECQRSVEQSAADDPFVRQLVQADAVAQRQTSGPQDSEGTITLPIPSNPHNAPASGLPIGSTNRSQAGRPGFSRPEIDAEALRFRVDLMSGAGPSIEERLLNFAEEARSDLLRRLLIVEMEECLRANRPVPVDDYLQRFSDASLVERAYEQAVNRLAREAAAVQHLTEVFPKPFDAVGRFREYLFQSKIGEGGMGAVYKALHTRLERTVAFKVLTPDKMSSAEMISRFQREMKSVGKLEHPNIVRAHDAGDEQGCNFLVMEFVDGVPLDVLLKRRGPLPVREACEIIRQAAVGLDYAHRHGLVHRDVKPSNLMIAGVASRSSRSATSLSSPSHARLPATVVMPPPVPPTAPSTSELRVAAPNQPASLDTDSMIHNAVETLVIEGEGKSFEAKTVTMSRSSLDLHDPLAISQASADPPAALSMREMAPMVKVLDLGLARLQSESHELTHESQVVGTLDYIAPEQARRGGNVDHRADIYSLGCTLFTLLAGRPPYGDAAHASIAQKVMAHVEEPLPSLSELRPDVPPRLLEVLQLMTDKQPARRYQSASAVADALAPFAQGANLRSLSDVGEGALATPVLLGQTHASVVATGTTITLASQPIRRRRLVAGTAALLIVLIAAFVLRSKLGEPASNSNSRRPESPMPQVASTTVEVAKPLPPPMLSDDYEWTEPENLGPHINTTAAEDHACLSADGLQLIFIRQVNHTSDLWWSVRAAPTEPWSVAQRMPDGINSPQVDQTPFLSADGLSLWFSSNRSGGSGQSDLYVARRETPDGAFGPPILLGPEINSSYDETSPFVSADGLTLLFGRGSPRLIYQSTRPSVDAPFGKATVLANVNSGKWHEFPRLTRDGLHLLLIGSTASVADQGLIIASRENVTDDFGPPQTLGAMFRTGIVSGPSLSSDETAIYFSARRSDPALHDLWVTRRVRKGSTDRDVRVTDAEGQPLPAVAPFGSKAAREFQDAWAKHLQVEVETTNSVGMKLRLIPPGEFLMGAPESDQDAMPQERPQHSVTLTKPFYLGATEVTVAQFRTFVEATKYVTEVESDGQGAYEVNKKRRPDFVWHKLNEVGVENSDEYPVRCVSWEDARQFCDWLSQTEGREYRLPTDAEWEFACRAGTKTRYSFGNDFDSTQVSGVSGSQLSAVAKFPANPFGLFDMHGNLNEICWDSNRTFTADSVSDPVGSLDLSSPAVVRGGAVSSSPARLRSSQRYINDSRRAPEANFATFVKGFRVVLRIEPK